MPFKWVQQTFKRVSKALKMRQKMIKHVFDTTNKLPSLERLNVLI